MRSVSTSSARGAVERGERGFGVIELLISVAITVVVLAGAFRAFEDARRASDAGSLLADGSQNLRMGVTLMTRDIMQTGRELPNAGIPIPRGTGIQAIARPGPPGSNLTFPGTWTVLPSICPGSAIGPALNGLATDIITVLYADSTLALNQYPLTAIAADGSTMTVDSRTTINGATNGLQPGDLIWFTNAVGNAIQTVTSFSGLVVTFAASNANDAFRFNQRSATSGSIMQIRSGTTFPTTSATRVTMVTYYLDSVTAPGEVRLMRREGFKTARLVAQGVENLQMTYDIVDGTVNPTNQVDAVSPYSPSQIRKVNLFLGRRSETRSLQTGRVARSSVATQVALRSMSFMDRYR